MKTVKTIGALVLVALLLQIAGAQEKPNGQSTPSGAAPILVIDSFTHDFGEVKAGTPLRFAFKVKNEGKADLVINSVSPG
ncbi:MAG: DUF1573 domain-containing protein [Acidobacteriota bacterium]